MLICHSCRKRIGSDRPESSRSFPAYTLVGGLLSTVGAAATGILLLVPAGIVIGALADSSGRRCEMCSGEIGEGEPAYHLMEELGGDRISTSYRPVRGPVDTGPSHRQPPSPAQPAQGWYPYHLTGERARTEPQHISLHQADASGPAEPTFREEEGKLVPTDTTGTEAQDQLGLAGDSAGGPDPDTGSGQTLGLDGNMAGPPHDGFTGFDDPATGIDVPDWFDDPPLGEL